MTDEIVVLSCSGLGKTSGIITQEVGLKLKELNPSIKLLCSADVLFDTEKYSEIIKESTVIVLDGCAKRCATKILEKTDFKKVIKIFIPEESKKHNIKIGQSSRLSHEDLELVDKIAQRILDLIEKGFDTSETIPKKAFDKVEYFEVTYDKYLFRVPKEGYLFSDNDCWVKPMGKTALIGITDYLQNSASDIIFVELPEIGQMVEQFDEIVDFESVKALLQLISPVSGKIIAINKQLIEEADLLNSDPYEQGWTVEIELNDFDNEKDLLMNGEEYFEFMKKKVEKEQ